MKYLNGKVVIHHDRKFQVMTNSPTYEKQLTLNNYCEGVDGSKTLPGSHQSVDRFVHASYYLRRLGDAETDARKPAYGRPHFRQAHMNWNFVPNKWFEPTVLAWRAWPAAEPRRSAVASIAKAQV